MATASSRFSSLAPLTRQQRPPLDSFLPVTITARTSAPAARLPNEPRRNSSSMRVNRSISRESNHSRESSSGGPLSSTSAQRGVSIREGSPKQPSSGAKAFRAVVSFAVRKLRGGGAWEGQHDGEGQPSGPEERDRSSSMEMGVRVEGVVESGSERSNLAGAGADNGRVRRHSRSGAWEMEGGECSRVGKDGKRGSEGETRFESEAKPDTERGLGRGGQLDRRKPDARYESSEGSDVAFTVSKSEGSYVVSQCEGCNIVSVSQGSYIVSEGSNVVSEGSNVVSEGSNVVSESTNGAVKALSEGMESARAAETESFREGALEQQHAFQQQRLRGVLGPAAVAGEKRGKLGVRIKGPGAQPQRATSALMHPPPLPVESTQKSSHGASLMNAAWGPVSEAPQRSTAGGLIHPPSLPVGFPPGDGDVAVAVALSGLDVCAAANEEREDEGEEEEGGEEGERRGRRGKMWRRKVEKGVKRTRGGRKRRRKSHAGKWERRKQSARACCAEDWLSLPAHSPGSLMLLSRPLSASQARRVVARAFNSLPRIRMGVLLDVARSVRASAGGMGAWSMRDLTHGLYLLSLQHAQERAVDSVASTPVTDEQTVQDLIYHCEFARASIATTHRTIAQACMVRPNRIIKIVPKARYGRPAYFIALDDKRRLVVVSFRGTRSAHDMLTNLAAHSVHVSTVQSAVERAAEGEARVGGGGGGEGGKEGGGGMGRGGEERSGSAQRKGDWRGGNEGLREEVGSGIVEGEEGEGDFFIESDGMEGASRVKGMGVGSGQYGRRSEGDKREERKGEERRREGGRSKDGQQPKEESMEDVAHKGVGKGADRKGRWPEEDRMEDVVGEEERRDMDEVIAFGHYGMVQAAETFVHEEAPLLRHLLAHHPGYDLRLIGHSLGAAVAALVTILLRPQAEVLLGVASGRVRCVGFATPPCVSRHLALSCGSFITTVVLQPGYDLRLIGHSLGAAVAALVTILLRPQAEALLGVASGTVRCVGFTTPPCVSRHLALSCRSFITTMVLQVRVRVLLKVREVLQVRVRVLLKVREVLQAEALLGVGQVGGCSAWGLPPHPVFPAPGALLSLFHHHNRAASKLLCA
ncbi:hypothetical protein CLOM_g2802 [Closterium sp. NIES-68]|nr:hypothetical protein CLOM_g2802 [Closterium sp. NIES-68]